jgi:quercetin dioxygenase-like cupin family protein
MVDHAAPNPPIRRVVTGHDANFHSIVTMDGPADNHKWPSHGLNCSTLIWYTDEMPAEIWSDEDYGARTVERQPVPRGARICVIDFLPGCPGMMHRTDTLDYVVCLSGEIDMELDEGASVHMRAGDVMVQQGTNHSWVNNGSETCRLGFVMLDGKKRPGPGDTAAPPTKPNDLTGNPPDPPIRRIITTHDENGRAIVGSDENADNHKWSPRGSTSTLIWSTDECPAEIWTDEDYGARKLGTQPPPNGTRFTIMNLPPNTPGRMHRTDTVDIIFVMDGKIDMGMDEGASVTLEKGDVMVQQGTNHSWDNVYDENCRLAIILIDGKPGTLENTA